MSPVQNDILGGRLAEPETVSEAPAVETAQATPLEAAFAVVTQIFADATEIQVAGAVPSAAAEVPELHEQCDEGRSGCTEPADDVHTALAAEQIAHAITKATLQQVRAELVTAQAFVQSAKAMGFSGAGIHTGA